MENKIYLIGRESGSKCGYCKSISPSKSTFYFHAFSLTPAEYQSLIDRGWRRSGVTLYKPNLAIDCCCQYTIRLDTSKFGLSKSTKKIIKGIAKLPEIEDFDQMFDASKDPLISLIESTESKKLKVVVEQAQYSDESYNLFELYQKEIHKDIGIFLFKRSIEVRVQIFSLRFPAIILFEFRHFPC